MKIKTFLLFFYLIQVSLLFSQVTSQLLSKKEVEKIFTEEVKKENNIKFDIIKCYKYSDNSGDYYTILTQLKSKKQISEYNHGEKFLFLKGYVFKIYNNNLIKYIVFTDALQNEFESTIFHWTKYFHIDDYNDDGIVDNIFVYGAEGENNTRYKILIYYKGIKIALRMTDGNLDDSRSVKIDESFYKLPVSLQERILKLMRKMESDNSVVFPYRWKEKIKNKKTSFENGSNE